LSSRYFYSAKRRQPDIHGFHFTGSEMWCLSWQGGVSDFRVPQVSLQAKNFEGSG